MLVDLTLLHIGSPQRSTSGIGECKQYRRNRYELKKSGSNPETITAC